ALACKGCGHVEIAFHIEGQPLGASKPAIEGGNIALRVNLVHTIEAGSRRPGHEQVAVGAKGKVISRDAGLQRGEDKNLPVAGDFENSAAAVADVEVLRPV